MNSQERRLLLLLASINFTHILDFMIIMPLGNYLMPYFGISTQQFSLIVSAYSYAAFTSGILAVFVVDRFDRKRTLLFGYSGFVLGTLLCGIAPDYKFLMAARVLAGLFGGLIGAQVQSIVADTFPYEKRGRAMGYLMAAFSVASVAGIPLSLYLANAISWHAPFIMVAFLGMLLIPLSARYVPSVRAHVEAAAGRSRTEAFRVIFSRRAALMALSFTALLMFGHFLIIPFLNPYMEFNVGFTKQQVPLTYVVGGVATLFSAPLFGRLADQYGKMRMFTLTALSSLPLVYVITHLPAWPFYVVLVVSGVWFIVVNGRMIAAQALVSNVMEPAYRGSFMSLNASLQQLCVGSAAIVAGLMVRADGLGGRLQHYGRLGWLSIAVLVVCMYVGYWLKKLSGLR